jgi:hypothetical protein
MPELDAALTDLGILPRPIILASSGLKVSHTGDTNEHTFATVTFPAGFVEAGDILQIDYMFGLNNITSGTPWSQVALNSLNINGGYVEYASEKFVYNGSHRVYINTVSGGGEGTDPGQQYASNADSSFQYTGFGLTTDSAGVDNLSADLREIAVLTFAGTLGNAANTMTLYGYTVLLYKQLTSS